MMWLAALTMLLFQGLAVCTIGIMVTSGLGFGVAMLTAVAEVILGVIIVRAMCRDMQKA
ncbi:MAG TPA: hypothetical protein VMW86_06735 [Dehalococcoidales bacterium]|nr:hypothetical protein [Dehalococcoidales bacterium]